LAAWLVLGLAVTPAAAAPTPKVQSTEPSTGTERLPTHGLPTKEQLLAVLQQRAEDAIEARKAQAPKPFEITTSLVHGYENNVNLDATRTGDHYIEESAGFFLRPQVRPWLSLEGSYQARNTHFTEFRDSNTWSNTLGTLVRWTPHTTLSLDAGYEYEIFNYPFDTSNSFTDHRLTTTLRHILSPLVFHEASWSVLLRSYDTRKALDPSAVETPNVREDQRHTVAYDLGLLLGETVVRLRQEFFENLSNEGFEDFYDWQDYRARLTASRAFFERWLATGSVSFERRNYADRTVPNEEIAEKDDLTTLSCSLIYELSKDWSVAYTWLWREQHSNDRRLDFNDTINQWGFYGRF